ncbi:hypothetical protein F5B22DRAFT_585332 [Xylaria bambusicola]|uniref:uncharacterized protein n=1 Tax=Xylaria bambusicola TaxID=326684 RepID=UPI0020071FB5|nr:uncharacterized protein F5B22DRAFT_585332 [Xylaria bambusicola]KAI0526328.1 hypothetical protein F5B22DRAFT_585332 [Xylaria bambusicola]
MSQFAMSFGRFICAQCTRRLSRVDRSFKSLSNPIYSPIMPTSQLSQKLNTFFLAHYYSTRKVARISTTRDTFAKVRFTRDDIPPQWFWEKAKEMPGADLSANEYQKAAELYVNMALKNTPQWRQRFIAVDDSSPPDSGQGKALSAHILHYVALMLVMTRTSSSKTAGHLAMHILHSLSGLGYAPSTLTIMRMALARNLLREPQFEPAVEKFERILKRIGDGSNSSSDYEVGEGDYAADACTLRAMMYEREDTREGDISALRWFRRAYELGQSTASTTDHAHSEEKQDVDTSTALQGDKNAYFNPHWQWKVSFALGVGRIRMRRGETEKAKDMFTMASSELDNADGYLAMADVLEQMGEADTEKYLESVEKAAISGKREAARKLGLREWDRATERGLSKWEKRKRQAMAEEWMAIADSAAPAEGTV